MSTSITTITVVLLHTAAVVSILLYERRRPTATLAWLVTLVFVPIGGLILFMLIGRPTGRRVAGRYAEVVARVDAAIERHAVRQKISGVECTLDERSRSFLNLAHRVATTPASQGNHTEILIDGADTYAAIADAVRAARGHVHIEFYIIQPDEIGHALRALLVDRAMAGIEVRVLCDGVGSGKLPRDFWQPLVEAGGEAAFFRPAARILAALPFRDRIDFRNHRKLVIVDGRIGFTGGINVGREYLGLDPEMGAWRDTHVQIEGPAVLALQKVFVEDWLDATDVLLDHERYFPHVEACGDDRVQIVDSGPDRDWSPIELTFVHAFALARERIWITSPYFVPSESVESALTAAALRGVDVRLLVPAKPDHRIVAAAAASYFPALLNSGAKIYCYQRGFVHAKTLVVDDWIGSIGSANMDMRSFKLNYELNAFVLGHDFCEAMAHQFELDIARARPLDTRQVSILRRLLRSIARSLSPLL